MRLSSTLVIAALGLVLVGLLVESARMLAAPRHRERRPQPAPVLGDEPAQPPEPPARPALATPAPPANPAPAAVPAPARAAPKSRGTAYLRGRVVVVGQGDDDDEHDNGDGSLDDLTVTAEDGRREIGAQVEEDGHRFSLHLPSGRYTLTARASGLVGAADVLAEAGSEREVLIALERAVEITGQMRGDGESEVTVHAFRAGSNADATDGSVNGREFSLSGLRAGQAYDLDFSGEGLRPTRLRNVIAPAEGLEVNLAHLPVLHGAIGFRTGESCPVSHVQVSKPGDEARPRDTDSSTGEDEDDSGAAVDDACRFELTLPADATEVRVVATGTGWHLEEDVAVPAEGDPPPLCLNAPC